MAASRVAALVLLSLVSLSQARRVQDAVSPIEKVVQLMTNLKEKVMKEGTDEAASYDKYSCFCREQNANKQSAIKKARARIQVLKADIEQAKTNKEDAASKIEDYTNDADDADKKMKQALDDKTAKQEECDQEKAEYDSAVGGTTDALDAIKSEKAHVTGTMFAQLNALPAKAKAHPSVSALLQRGPTTEYKAGDIIATLESLVSNFKESSREAFEECTSIIHGHTKDAAQYAIEKDQANKKKVTQEGREAKEASIQAAKEQEKTDTEHQKKEDQKFLESLRDSCKEKTELWNQRTEERAKELTGLSKAIGILAHNQKHNSDAAMSFIQEESNTERQTARVQLTLTRLEGAADKLKSPVLSALAIKARFSADHFVKVRNMIDDMVKTLEDEAEAEADKKATCDDQLSQTLSDRDDESRNMEEAMAEISKQKAQIEESTKILAELQAKKTQLFKDLSEADGIRKQEKGQAEKALSETEAGIEAVNKAIQVLEPLYGFVQTHKKPGEKKLGKKASEDEAPDSDMDEEYSSKSAEGGNIMALLTTIRDTMVADKKATKKEEDDAQADFDTFKSDTESSVDTTNGAIDDEKQTLTDAKGDHETADEDFEDSKDAKEAALRKLEDLKAMCIENGESYEERKAKRQQEIQQLKDAMAILEDEAQ